MRTSFTIASAALLMACDGGTPGTDTGTPADPCEESGNVCTWLGVPLEGRFTGENTDRGDGWTTGTWLFLPVDITFASDGTAYYPDYNNHRVRKVSTDDVVTTVSGTGFLGDGPDIYGSVINCWTGCDAMASAWNHPTHVAPNPADESQLYVSAWHNSRLNIIDQTTNTMSWYAGTGGRFYGGGLDPATAALPPEEQVYTRNLAIMDLPSSIAFGADGTLYFSDQANHMIRKIAPGSDKLEILAGQILPDVHPDTGAPIIRRQPGFDGDGGDATLAKLHGHTDQKADPGSKILIDGNVLLTVDSVNGVVRSIDLDTNIIDTVVGKYESLGEVTFPDAVTGVPNTFDAGSVTGYSGDGGDALEAVFNTPRDLALGIDGELYIADTMNHCVRVVRDGIVDTYAGICNPSAEAVGYSGDGGPATEAMFTDTFGIDVDAEGNLYIADTRNHIIRRVKH